MQKYRLADLAQGSLYGISDYVRQRVHAAIRKVGRPDQVPEVRIERRVMLGRSPVSERYISLPSQQLVPIPQTQQVSDLETESVHEAEMESDEERLLLALSIN